VNHSPAHAECAPLQRCEQQQKFRFALARAWSDTSHKRISARFAPERDPAEDTRQWLLELRDRVSLGDVLRGIPELENGRQEGQLAADDKLRDHVQNAVKLAAF
jgi:hypothetical protein